MSFKALIQSTHFDFKHLKMRFLINFRAMQASAEKSFFSVLIWPLIFPFLDLSPYSEFKFLSDSFPGYNLESLARFIGGK